MKISNFLENKPCFREESLQTKLTIVRICFQNQKYHEALKMAIDKMHGQGRPANVLDIGTGTGLLSMMAVSCGADSVTACEVSYCCILFHY